MPAVPGLSPDGVIIFFVFLKDVRLEHVSLHLFVT